jgi:hypothetical protein
MTRRAVNATVVAVFVCVLSACGGTAGPRAPRTAADGATAVKGAARPYVVLSLSGLGAFEGRCPRAARLWTLRFVADPEASESVFYRVGSGARHVVNFGLPPNTITFHLAASATRTHEPAERFVPPRGQPQGVLTAQSAPTTLPLQAVIYQATEPGTLQADVRLTLAADRAGENGQCALVGSTVQAYAYSNG